VPRTGNRKSNTGTVVWQCGIQFRRLWVVVNVILLLVSSKKSIINWFHYFLDSFSSRHFTDILLFVSFLVYNVLRFVKSILLNEYDDDMVMMLWVEYWSWIRFGVPIDSSFPKRYLLPSQSLDWCGIFLNQSLDKPKHNYNEQQHRNQNNHVKTT